MIDPIRTHSLADETEVGQCPACITKHGIVSSPDSCHHSHLHQPGAHLAEVVKVVLVPDPPVTGLSTVWLVSDVPGVLALAHEELPFEELNTHIPGDREKWAVSTASPDQPWGLRALGTPWVRARSSVRSEKPWQEPPLQAPLSRGSLEQRPWRGRKGPWGGHWERVEGGERSFTFYKGGGPRFSRWGPWTSLMSTIWECAPKYKFSGPPPTQRGGHSRGGPRDRSSKNLNFSHFSEF